MTTKLIKTIQQIKWALIIATSIQNKWSKMTVIQNSNVQNGAK